MCSAVVGVSLYFVYALTVVLFLQHLILSSVILIEVVIILAQFAKLAGVVGHYGKKPARPKVLLILFSFETLIVLVLIVVYATSPSVYMSNLVNIVFSTWVAALFIVTPSYLIFAAVMQMTRNRSPIVSLLSPTLGFGFLAFAASTMLASSSNFTFASFFQYLIGVARYDIASGTIPALTHLYILIPSVAVFSSMFIYATVPTSTSMVPPRVSFVLPLLAAIVTLAWVLAGVVVQNTLLSFTLPGMIVVALLWVYMRR